MRDPGGVAARTPSRRFLVAAKQRFVRDEYSNWNNPEMGSGRLRKDDRDVAKGVYLAYDATQP